MTDAAKQYVADNGFDPVYGARPLKRYVQHTIETLLAKDIVGNKILPDSVVTVDVKDGDLTLTSKTVA